MNQASTPPGPNCRAPALHGPVSAVSEGVQNGGGRGATRPSEPEAERAVRSKFPSSPPRLCRQSCCRCRHPRPCDGHESWSWEHVGLTETPQSYDRAATRPRWGPCPFGTISAGLRGSLLCQNRRGHSGVNQTYLANNETTVGSLHAQLSTSESYCTGRTETPTPFPWSSNLHCNGLTRPVNLDIMYPTVQCVLYNGSP